MSKIMMGLLLGFLIGVICRYFDIPLPSPTKLIGVLIVLSITLGYVGMDYLLARPAIAPRSAARPATTAQYCGGPTGFSLSHQQAEGHSENAPTTERDQPVQ